jgi:hypothetical protein
MIRSGFQKTSSLLEKALFEVKNLSADEQEVGGAIIPEELADEETVEISR